MDYSDQARKVHSRVAKFQSLRSPCSGLVFIFSGKGLSIMKISLVSLFSFPSGNKDGTVSVGLSKWHEIFDQHSSVITLFAGTKTTVIVKQASL